MIDIAKARAAMEREILSLTLNIGARGIRREDGKTAAEVEAEMAEAAAQLEDNNGAE